MRSRLLPVALSLALTSTALTAVAIGTSVGVAHATPPGINGMIFGLTDDGRGTTLLTSVKPDGTGMQQIDAGESPAVDPSGTRVAYFDKQAGVIRIQSIVGYHSSVLTTASQSDTVEDLAWAADGSLVAEVDRYPATPQLVRLSLSGNPADYPLTLSAAGPRSPEVTVVGSPSDPGGALSACSGTLRSSPTANAVLVVRNACGFGDAHRVVTVTSLTPGAPDTILTTGLYNPSFTPDGKHLIGTWTAPSTPAAAYGSLVIENLDGSSPQQSLGDGPTYALIDPVYSPDGKEVLSEAASLGGGNYVRDEGLEARPVASGGGSGFRLFPVNGAFSTSPVFTDAVWAPAPPPARTPSAAPAARR